MTRINQIIADRIKGGAITGPALLQMFELLEAQMETVGAQGNFTQFQFVRDITELKEGDLIPEIHLSLRPFSSEEIDFAGPGEIDNVGTDPDTVG